MYVFLICSKFFLLILNSLINSSTLLNSNIKLDYLFNVKMLMNASINKFSLPGALFINRPLVPIMLSSNFLFLPLTILNNKNIMGKMISRPDAATGITTAMRKALTAELMEMKSQSDLLADAGFIITPDDPQYGLSANEANEVCEKVLGRGKYNLFEVNGKFVGVMCNFI